MKGDDQPFLRLDDIEAVYDGVIVALRGVSLDVPRGAIVALLGANGAGKTTVLKAISNLLAAEGGAIRRGEIVWRGRSIGHAGPARLVADGLVQVLEGRHCFPQLTVEENLLAGGYVRRLSSRRLRTELERIYALFPQLKARSGTLAGLTSGGEQQMIAIGRALMTQPQLVLLDEPSMGLAPMVITDIFESIRRLRAESGVTFLVAEQNTNVVLRYADHGYVLENGVVALSGTAAELAEGSTLRDLYFGMPPAVSAAPPPTGAGGGGQIPPQP